MPWARGVPALVTLAVVAVAAIGLAHCATSRTGEAAPRMVQAHAIATGIVAAVFWVWAIANCAINKSFDLGVASFFTVLISSIAQYKKSKTRSRLGAQRWHTCGSCGFVVLNYTLGLALVSAASVQMYFGVAAVAWLVAAAIGWSICQQYEQAKTKSGDGEHHERMVVGL